MFAVIKVQAVEVHVGAHIRTGDHFREVTAVQATQNPFGDMGVRFTFVDGDNVFFMDESPVSMQDR